MKRGDTIKVEIIKIEDAGITVFVYQKQKEVFIPNEELKVNFLKKLDKGDMLNQQIYARIQSLRPLKLSCKRVNLDKEVGLQSKSAQEDSDLTNKKKKKKKEDDKGDNFFVGITIFVILSIIVFILNILYFII